MKFDFTNQNVVITGGASGIGLEIAKAYEKYGATVFICDIDSGKINLLNDRHKKIQGFKADVGIAPEVESFFDFIKEKTQIIDVLINNAGIAGPTALVQDIEPEAWDRTLEVGLNGMFYATRLAVPMLLKNEGGAIINMASSAAYFGFPFRAPYTAAKWGVIGFTKTIAMELGPKNIRANAICPGSVKGPRIDSVIEKEAKLRGISFEEVKEGYERQVSMRSFVDASDIANMCLFLSSPYGAMVSGQALGIDGHTETLTNF